MKKLFLATGNKKKIKEISDILEGYEILSINDGYKIPDVIEDKDTFEGNSQKKAIEIAKKCKTATQLIQDHHGCYRYIKKYNLKGKVYKYIKSYKTPAIFKEIYSCRMRLDPR